MKRFSVTCELAGGDYALGWVDTIDEATTLAATHSDRRTRIWDRNSKYLDSIDGFWRRTIDGTRVQ